ncbi:hypothetical protein PSTG_04111 [Puccinia striiformis f. sp. tritici PST-78]|uniref:Uncharacterized protein n=1 Tax=Puccinia striiformis f. sp. tritici PST-78 TaxID=1165861 RepID=A0A0L0VU79_9BASI|nr:hypothetical protein PSTG_04111 [Puccinia striiformis f. sp. tritici PST-78]
MFYSTVWIGEVWIPQSSSPTTIIEDQHEKETRIGAIGLLSQSILALLSWLIIPRFITQFRIHRYGTRSGLDFEQNIGWVPFTLLGEALLHKPDQLRIPLVSVLPDPDLPTEGENADEVSEETILPPLKERESLLEILISRSNEEDKEEGLIIDTLKNDDDSQLVDTVLISITCS